MNFKTLELRRRLKNFPKTWYGEGKDVDFEGYRFPAPDDAHNYLAARYRDYMTPRSYGGHVIAVFDTEHSYLEYFDEQGHYIGPPMEDRGPL